MLSSLLSKPEIAPPNVVASSSVSRPPPEKTMVLDPAVPPLAISSEPPARVAPDRMPPLSKNTVSGPPTVMPPSIPPDRMNSR